MSLIERGGEAVSDDIWHRLVQIVGGTPALQPYAATRVFQALNSGVEHEVLVKVRGWMGWVAAPLSLSSGPLPLCLRRMHA